MSKVNELFEKELCVVNFGIESFYQDLKKQNVKAVHVAWKPVAGGDKKIAGYLKQLKDPKLAEKIEAANKEALRRILAAQPALVGMSTAGEAIPGMTKTTILHAGPPVKWENMCGPMKGAVMGGLIYEGLAKDLKEAEELAADAFGAAHAFLMVGGTTSSVQTMVLTACKRGDEIILPRNVHRSVLNALVLCGAIPVYVNPEVDQRLWNFPGNAERTGSKSDKRTSKGSCSVSK